jgi:hypothetical protein
MKYAHTILPNLHLGTLTAASDPHFLCHNRITHILNLSQQPLPKHAPPLALL